MKKRMSSAITLISVFIVSLLATPQFVTKVAAQDYAEHTGTLDGADWALRIPEPWNGMLVVICQGGFTPLNPVIALTMFSSSMLNQGFAVAASNYGAEGWPVAEGVESTYQLTNYIIENYGVTGRVFLYGFSLGGGVALLLGEEYPDIYSGVLDLFGIKDMKHLYTHAATWANMTDEELTAELTALGTPVPPPGYATLQEFRDGLALLVSLYETVCGGTPWANPTGYEALSPTYHANIQIPVITVHGTADTFVPHYQSIMYKDAVAQAGKAHLYRLYNVTGAGHGTDDILAEMPMHFAELVSWVDAITPPTVTVSSPTNTTYQEDPQLQFTVDKSVTWMGYSLDGQSNVTTTENTINLTKLPNGLHSLTVYANDTDGNTGASETITFTIQKVLPIIAILSPENTTYSVAEIMLNFTVNDEVSEITCCLDEQDNMIIGGNTTLTGLTNGNHKVTILATDTSGNTIQSETIYFTVDAGLPTWVMGLIAFILIMACAAILLYFKKIKKTENTTTNT